MVTVKVEDGTDAHDRTNAEQAALRDRTDEMELIISGLTTFALLSLPGWLLDRYADLEYHFSVSVLIAAGAALTIVVGLCYALGACFLVHLASRAYWVGLVGLRTVFPDGIDWSRTPGIGPLVREYYQSRMASLDGAIRAADRFASTLFSVIGLVAISVGWVGMLLLSTLVVAGVVGSYYGAINSALRWATLGMLLVVVGTPILAWLLDSGLGRLWPGLRGRAPFRRTVRALVRITWLVFPQRLILPVQLTLQSNTRPLVFIVCFGVGILLVVVGGTQIRQMYFQFTQSTQFTYLDWPDTHEGMRSVHYEDQQAPADRIRFHPTIPAAEQDTGFVRLFLPYYPLRDNPVLDRLCPGEERRADCLRRLWQVRINGREVSMERFLPAQRTDRGRRGLIGYVPLSGVRPGMQRLDVRWNPEADETEIPFDDRYQKMTSDYVIPFLFSPPFEQELEPQTGATPATGE